jgi:mRNA interferase YafQ
MYELRFERVFVEDYKRIKKLCPRVASEFQEVLREMSRTGTPGSGYSLHELTKTDANYFGCYEFHLSEGRSDVLVIYIPHKSNPVIRFIRMGSHRELFSAPEK